jgi:predicted 3-demethylubiquinone-9 3-methyltransferase (glyoxalase superfamily)
MTTLSLTLWFAEGGRMAADRYLEVIPGSKLIYHRSLPGTPGGTAEVTSIALPGIGLEFLTAQPGFPRNPSITLSARCRSREGAVALWQALSDGGVEMMPFQDYPFSPLFGWCTDRFGVSWQVQLVPDATTDLEIVPVLMFVGENLGNAGNAARLYTSAIPASDYSDDSMVLYGAEAPEEIRGMVMIGESIIAGSRVAVMDSPGPHTFGFTEGTSLVVLCDTQEEVDKVWSALSAVPEAEQCGWLKDRFGVSWQVVPRDMERMMTSASDDALARVIACFLPMKKFDIATLRAAEAG